MSGDNKSVKDKLKDYEKILDEYINKIGIGKISYNCEIEDIICMSKKELSGLTPEECGENAFILDQYASYLDKEYNRQQSRIIWAKHDLNSLIARVYSNYKSKEEMVKYELVIGRIQNSDSVAASLMSIIKYAETYASELQNMSQSIRTMAKDLKELQQTKRYRR